MGRRRTNAGQLAAIEEAVGYEFADRGLLRRAMVHRSYLHEASEEQSNESLEFLGDAVLGFLVAERIVRRRQELDEGAMTRLRAGLVNEDRLAAEAARIGLGEALLLGRGEEASGGRAKPSLLADAFEALVGAVLLDGGVRATRGLVRRCFGVSIDSAPRAGRPYADAKTELQELVQARGWALPRYRLVERRGPDHDLEFVVEVVVADEVLGRGVGGAKRRAEQAAAGQALARLSRSE